MIDDELLKLGFREFKPTAFESNGVETCFQKRYDDEMGKKYFITVKKWRAWQHPAAKQDVSPTYEYTVQLYKKNGHEAVDLLFHSDWALESVEQYLDELWKTGLFEYYREF